MQYVSDSMKQRRASTDEEDSLKLGIMKMYGDRETYDSREKSIDEPLSIKTIWMILRWWPRRSLRKWAKVWHWRRFAFIPTRRRDWFATSAQEWRASESIVLDPRSKHSSHDSRGGTCPKPCEKFDGCIYKIARQSKLDSSGGVVGQLRL